MWSDEVKNRVNVLHPVAQRRPGEIPDSVENKLGATESERIARLAVVDPTIEVLGVLCIAKDPRAAQRERQTFDDRTVFRMNVQEEDGKIVAHLVSRVEARSIAKK